MFLFFYFSMRKLLISFLATSCALVWFSFAIDSITNISYTVNGNDVKLYRTDNSNWWYMDVNLQDPRTKDWLHFGEVKMSDEVFAYTRQWDWDQQIQIIPWDGWDWKRFCVSPSGSACSISSDTKAEDTTKDESTTKSDDTSATWSTNRTVIPAVPKTGPSGSIIWIILAALAIFGGYIYIRKRADI